MLSKNSDHRDSDVMEQDDYRMFEMAKNKDLAAIASEFAAMKRYQRTVIAMTKHYLSQVPEQRREGVAIAFKIHEQNLVDMERRFVAVVGEIEQAQLQWFDSRMRIDTEIPKFVHAVQKNYGLFGFLRRKRQEKESHAAQAKFQDVLSDVRSSVDKWSQSMSLSFRLLGEWRRMQEEMLTFLETQKEEYREVKKGLDQVEPKAMPKSSVSLVNRQHRFKRHQRANSSVTH